MGDDGGEAGDEGGVMSDATAHATNKAALALGLGLAGMTWERWKLLSTVEREKLRDNSGLSPQLVDHEGHRVEVIDNYGQTRRFWVGKSTGWQPCHIELKLRTSSGGMPADKLYVKVTRVSKRSRLHSLPGQRY